MASADEKTNHVRLFPDWSWFVFRHAMVFTWQQRWWQLFFDAFVMPELRKWSKVSSHPSFRLFCFSYSVLHANGTLCRLLIPPSTGREISDTHSLQSLYFSTASRLRNKWWKKRCCELSNLLTKHPSSSLLCFLRRVLVYRIFFGNCFLPNYVTNSIWTKFDAAFRSIPLTCVARGVVSGEESGFACDGGKVLF